MSCTTLNDTALLVGVTDAEGHALGRRITVYLSYVRDVDSDYGADTDGRRGQLSITDSILDCWIDAEDLMTLDSGQVERLLADAKAMFDSRDPDRKVWR
jgi:hypothetical protein